MSYVRPTFRHPDAQKNKLGYTRKAYEGAISTLCAGCGHDSIVSSIITAFFEMSIEPHKVVKLSGIGCSSKTPAYFLGRSHGFNSVHGRMPSIATGALAGNRDLIGIGVSGDGDSLSIGFGQFGHVIRRNVNMLYLIENNGVYGLTKGQFSASADAGSTSKKGEVNQMQNINAVATAISMGASFVGRGFSGDRDQLVPLIKSAIAHPGCAVLDVISPCVTFNDHEGSTKSYAHTRQFYHHVVDADFIPPAEEIKAAYEEGSAMSVELHDGSKIVLRKVDDRYDPTSRAAAFKYLRERFNAGEIVTGLLYIDDERKEMHDLMGNVDTPFAELPMESLRPPKGELQKILKPYR